MAAIRVLDHDPRWAALFVLHKHEIGSLLAGLVSEVYHIGSTAVPGLAAKPKLDIDAVVGSRRDIGAAVERVLQAGFVFHGDPYGDERWTFTRDGHDGYGIRLYICAPGNRAHVERLMFRDWLRVHPEDAGAYAALKRKLAAEAGGDWDQYTGGKTAFVEAVLRKSLGQASGPPAPLAGAANDSNEMNIMRGSAGG